MAWVVCVHHSYVDASQLSGAFVQLTRNDTGLPRTHHTITRLVQVIVGTGALTGTPSAPYTRPRAHTRRRAALATTASLALFLALPHRAYHVAVALALAKLYSNALLVVQNSRVKIVGARNRSPRTTFDVGLDTTRIRFAARTAATSATSAPGDTWVQGEAVAMPDAEAEDVSTFLRVEKSSDLVGCLSRCPTRSLSRSPTSWFRRTNDAFQASGRKLVWPSG